MQRPLGRTPICPRLPALHVSLLPAAAQAAPATLEGAPRSDCLLDLASGTTLPTLWPAGLALPPSDAEPRWGGGGGRAGATSMWRGWRGWPCATILGASAAAAAGGGGSPAGAGAAAGGAASRSRRGIRCRAAGSWPSCGLSPASLSSSRMRSYVILTSPYQPRRSLRQKSG